MFFRREHLKNPAFAERLENLRHAGFTIAPMAGGVLRATRGGYAVDLKDENGTVAIAGCPGMARGSEIGALMDGGFQKFFQTPARAITWRTSLRATRWPWWLTRGATGWR